MWIATLKSQDSNIIVSVNDITAVKIDKIYPPLDRSYYFNGRLIEVRYRVLVAAKSDFIEVGRFNSRDMAEAVVNNIHDACIARCNYQVPADVEEEE